VSAEVTSVERQVRREPFVQGWLEILEEFQKHPANLNDTQRWALEQLLTKGFPTRRWEDWRFFPLGEVYRQRYNYVPPRCCNAFLPKWPRYLNDIDGYVFYLTSYWQRGQLPKGVVSVETDEGLIISNRERVPATPFALLNLFAFDYGLTLRVKNGVNVTQPIQIIHQAPEGVGESVFPRLEVTVEPGAQVTIIEHSISLNISEGFVCPLTLFHVGEDAVVNYIKIQEESERTLHLATQNVQIQRGGRFTAWNFQLGGRWTRDELWVDLIGEGAEVDLHGLYFPRNSQVLDNHTLINHQAPHTTARELYKGVLADEGRGIFTGRIIVQPGAQKIEALQTNRNLLLSDTAQAHSDPQLEIYADDVRCSHGPSNGALDEEALFYLRSRGIDVRAAQFLLVEGFLAEVLNGFPDETLKKELAAELKRRLEETIG